MRQHEALLVKMVAIAVTIGMAGIATSGQSKTQSSPATFTLKVDCNKKGSIGATLAHLSQTGNTRGVTISVTGTCKENITIGGFDHLVIQGSPGATLQDASNGTAAVVRVFSSFDVLLQNFTINGGAYGVLAAGVQDLTVSLSTIQQAAFDAVILEGATAGVRDSNILNNGFAGLRAENGSQLNSDSNTISNNVREGLVSSSSHLIVRGGRIEGNAVGVDVFGGSQVRVADVTISGNASDGLRLESGSTALFRSVDTGSVITGNGGNGVAIHDLSFGSFGTSVMDNVSGNLTQPDVACYPQFSATRGAATVGGTTNCPN